MTGSVLIDCEGGKLRMTAMFIIRDETDLRGAGVAVGARYRVTEHDHDKTLYIAGHPRREFDTRAELLAAISEHVGEDPGGDDA